MKETAILLIHCNDRKGIIAQVTEYINQNSGNIIYLDQYVDREKKAFFMRVEWDLSTFLVNKDDIRGDIHQILEKDAPTLQMFFSSVKPKMAIFVSKESHCLYDLLYHYQSGSWGVEIPLIISNHEELQGIAEQHGIDFYHIPKNKANKANQEQVEISLLKQMDIDFIVLARYMQIISPDFINEFPNKIINIHHSFLPAFVGAKPYHQAFARGVKVIGATSHYVTNELDAGPIIEQDVAHVDHRHTVKELVRKGKDLEKVVLSRAIYKHLERKVLVFDNKTIVFD